MKTRIYALSEVFFISLLIFSLFKLGSAVCEYYRGDKIYEEAEESIIDAGGKGNSALKVNIAKLKETNPDVIAWIYIEDTPVSYPIVRGSDNKYYLKHTYNKKSSAFGSIFADHRNSADFSDANTLIYGHNTKNGSMFGSLKKYKKEAYLKKHPNIYIICEDRTLKYRIFSVFTPDIYNRVYEIDRKSTEDLAKWEAFVHSQSVVKTAENFSPQGKGKYITLSTCVNNINEGLRFVVTAELVSDTESRGGSELRRQQ